MHARKGWREGRCKGEGKKTTFRPHAGVVCPPRAEADRRGAVAGEDDAAEGRWELFVATEGAEEGVSKETPVHLSCPEIPAAARQRHRQGQPAEVCRRAAAAAASGGFEEREDRRVARERRRMQAGIEAEGGRCRVLSGAWEGTRAVQR